MSKEFTVDRKVSLPHTFWDDMYGVTIGVLFCAMAVTLLKHGSLITGGVAGVALLLSKLLGQPPGLMVVLINVPFLVVAFVAMGRGFGFKTLIVCLLLGSAVEIVDRAVVIARIDSGFCALAGGTLLGMGILCLARHRASLGGTGVVVLWIQRKFGVNAGLSQLVFDVALFAISARLIAVCELLWSLAGTVAMNAIMFMWHRPGRYLG